MFYSLHVKRSVKIASPNHLIISLNEIHLCGTNVYFALSLELLQLLNPERELVPSVWVVDRVADDSCLRTAVVDPAHRLVSGERSEICKYEFRG